MATWYWIQVIDTSYLQQASEQVYNKVSIAMCNHVVFKFAIRESHFEPSLCWYIFVETG